MRDVRFRSSPLPDTDVVKLLESMLESARQGRIRTLAVVLVNPVHETQHITAGDLSPVRRNALLGGITQAKHALLARQ